MKNISPALLVSLSFTFLFVANDLAMPQQSSPQSAAQARAQSEARHPIAARPVANSTILSGGTHAETMQRLRVARTHALSELRANPQMTLGEAQLNFRPILENPHALFNVAPHLREISQHVELKENTSEITEVEQGLVLHHVLTYRILPGKCSDANARAQLAAAGVQCFTRASTSERVAEFSSPGSPRYVADPEKRRAAITKFQTNIAAAEAETSKHIAELRSALRDPTQRAAINAQVGQAEAARMDTLSDDQLKEELINSGTQRYEETMFIPKLESANYLHPQHTLTTAPRPGEAETVQQILRDGVPEHGSSPAAFPKLLKMVPASTLHLGGAPTGDRSADLEMGPYIFLTGFTVGHDYEWHWGAEITINWCLVGCSATYGIELHAGFNYGFGLRFPIRTQLKYHTVVHANNSAEATLTADFKPINGTVDDFLSAELPAQELYDAKEFVAQVGADAGFSISVPGFGVGHDFNVGVDFTDLLPPPYKGGHFEPPAPGKNSVDGDFVFDSLDLLGGLLDYGVAGGKLLPAVKVHLFSEKLQFTLNDEIQKRQSRLTSSPQTVPLAVSPGAGNDNSHFSLGNPVYNVGITLTPGLNPRLFIDIDIWSHNWDFPIWFPDLAVSLPSHGADFSCHADTTCVMDFQPVYDAATGQVKDMSKERDVAHRTLIGGGCQPDGPKGNYFCPVKGMLGLCQAMLKNGAVSSCKPLIPASTDQILKRGHCTGDNGNYVCPHDMIGLCELYLKNQVILSCKEGK